MSLADDLLQQAYQLARPEKGEPKQASLRRSISTAYYALFHLLVAESSQRLSPASPATLAPRIARAFVHAEMKQVCKAVSGGSLPAVLAELQPEGFSACLQDLATSFLVLQDERHRADYDLSATYTREGVLEIVDAATQAFADWQQVQSADEANVFLTALLLHKNWAR